MAENNGNGELDDRLFLEILLTEALSTEIKSFGIDAIVVYPGYFKTNFLLQRSWKTAANPISGYKEAQELEIMHNEQIIGKQPGDPP